MSQKTKAVVGIDLGTTFSCVGQYKEKRETVEICPSETGNRIVPSFVTFTDDERLVGDGAKNYRATRPENTIFDVKRLIGRLYTDPEVASDKTRWPFEVINSEGKPKIQVNFQGKCLQFYPEELSAMVLEKMVEVAKNFLHVDEIKNVVITVPAYFNDLQRQATKHAGEIAGLNVLRILNEPTAAAIAYGLDEKHQGHYGKKYILIYDLGGGTFDVTILTIKDKEFDVLASHGDTHLGGGDFDTNLVMYCADDFKKKHQVDVSASKRAMARIRKAVEEAKHTLSNAVAATIQLENLIENYDMDMRITRARFEALNIQLFRKTIKHVESALDLANLSKEQIDEIVLVGGSTRIPKVEQLVEEYFEKKPSKSINPDEAVAYGAAIYAAKLSENPSDALKQLVLTDVTPLSLGTDIQRGIMAVVVPRNRKLPVDETAQFCTMYDQQTAIDIGIFEGEREMVEDNVKLGEFTIRGIPPLPPGKGVIDVTFELDVSGILTVSAVVCATGNRKSTTISQRNGRLTDDEVKRLWQQAEIFKEDDQKNKERVKAKDDLEIYAINAISIADRTLSDSKKRRIDEECDEVLLWIEDHRNGTTAEFTKKLGELKSACEPLVGQI